MRQEALTLESAKALDQISYKVEMEASMPGGDDIYTLVNSETAKDPRNPDSTTITD